MADRGRISDRARAAGLAVAAVGIAAIVPRFARRLGTGQSEAPGPQNEFETGRGAPRGPVDPVSREAGYEVVDTNVKAVALVMLVALALMGGGIAAVFHMYAGFDKRFIAGSANDTTEQKATIVPPLPHLQADPYREIDATLMEQEHQLTTYGWSDAGHERAHIPIERAMRQVVGKPLDATAVVDAAGAPAARAIPAGDAATAEGKPANDVQGEGRPGAVAPRYDPARQPADTK